MVRVANVEAMYASHPQVSVSYTSRQSHTVESLVTQPMEFYSTADGHGMRRRLVSTVRQWKDWGKAERNARAVAATKAELASKVAQWLPSTL